MLKVRQAIIYILIAAVFWSPLGAERIALASEETSEIPPVVTDNAALERASDELANEGATFFLPQSTKAAVEEDLSGPAPENTDEGTIKWWNKISSTKLGQKSMADLFLASVRSLITGWTMLAVIAAHKRAHEKNLNLKPENVKALSEQLGNNWTTVQYAAYDFSTRATNVTSNASVIYIYDKLNHPFFKSAFMQKSMNYFFAGAILGVGTDYVRGFVNSAAEAILDHPDKFGDTSPEEKGALKLIQTSDTFFYFGDAVFRTGASEPDPNKRHQLLVFHNVGLKILSAMNVILLHDPTMLNAVWDHLFRTALLQGKNGWLVMTSLLSWFLTEKWFVGENSFWSRHANVKGLTVSLAVGFLGALIPDRLSDEVTAQANFRWADGERVIQNGWQGAELHLFSYLSPDRTTRTVDGIIADEKESRQSRFAKYAYIMNLALDRTKGLLDEKEKIGKISETTDKGTLQWIDYIYRQLLGVDFTSAHFKKWLNGGGINFYHNLFMNAAQHMLAIYSDESSILNKLNRQNLPPDARYRLSYEERNMEQMHAYVSHLVNNLSLRWQSDPLPVNFLSRLNSFGVIAFWGIREQDILRAIDNGRIIYR